MTACYDHTMVQSMIHGHSSESFVLEPTGTISLGIEEKAVDFVPACGVTLAEV
jgi:hypothetical protein